VLATPYGAGEGVQWAGDGSRHIPSSIYHPCCCACTRHVGQHAGVKTATCAPYATNTPRQSQHTQPQTAKQANLLRWSTHRVIEAEGLCLLVRWLGLGGLTAGGHLVASIRHLPQPAAALGRVGTRHPVAADREGGLVGGVVAPGARVPVGWVSAVQDGCVVATCKKAAGRRLSSQHRSTGQVQRRAQPAGGAPQDGNQRMARCHNIWLRQ
jgi:hypothetical protein